MSHAESARIVPGTVPGGGASTTYRVSYSIPSRGDTITHARDARVTLYAGYTDLGDVVEIIAVQEQCHYDEIRVEALDCVGRTDESGRSI